MQIHLGDSDKAAKLQQQKLAAYEAERLYRYRSMIASTASLFMAHGTALPDALTMASLVVRSAWDQTPPDAFQL